jgi:hypothetical protein
LFPRWHTSPTTIIVSVLVISTSETLVSKPSFKPTKEGMRREIDDPNDIQVLPLLTPRPGFTLIPQNRMQLNLDRIPLGIPPETFTPIIAHGVGKDISIFAKPCRDDAAADFRVPFEAVFGVFVPEVECAVGAGGAEGAVLRVEGDAVYRVDFCSFAGRGVLLAVAFEGEV